MQVGDAFIFNLAVSSDEHIYFVAHVEGNPTTRIVLFNFTSHYPGRCDESCIVRPHEYKRLSRDSVIAYRWGRIVEGSAIQGLVKTEIGKKLDPVPAAVIAKVKTGALKSQFTPLKIKKLFQS
jgi:hypothetical protein